MSDHSDPSAIIIDCMCRGRSSDDVLVAMSETRIGCKLRPLFVSKEDNTLSIPSVPMS